MSKERIEKLVEEYPKHFSQKIKRDTELHSMVQEYPGDSISEKVFNYLNLDQNICQNGNKKKFKDIIRGYGYCARTNKCECARKAVSEKVSQQKANYSAEEKAQINAKRSKTNLKKYGVENVGQTPQAKENHKKLYEDKQKVEQINSKVSQTKLLKYGSSTYNNSEKISETWKQKPDSYWGDRYPQKDLESLRDTEKMAELYYTKSIREICEELQVSETTVYRHLNSHNLRTPYVSAAEQEVENFLINDLGITNIQRNNRKILSGRELDFYLPDLNLAIEYNGVYWHHEDVPQIHKSYHQQKFKDCEAQGIQLLTIFSSHWTHKKELVKKMITHKVNLSQDTIYARKCVIVEPTHTQCKKFCEAHHIQGYAPCSIRYGLLYDNELVAIMGFSKLRPSLGQKSKDGFFELVRYATSKQVTGGASKLLSHFTKHHQWTSIISYSNNEWSNGGMYSALGFDFVRETEPGYWYVHPRSDKLMHRYQFAKHKLVDRGFDPRLTESEITKNHLQLMKIWDCGQKVWKFNFQN